MRARLVSQGPYGGSAAGLVTLKRLRDIAYQGACAWPPERMVKPDLAHLFAFRPLAGRCAVYSTTSRR